MIINASHISKSFGEESIIEDASLLINEHEKVAIVGLNGAGKTTLLRMLAGDLPPDSGTIHISKDASMGFLHQINDIRSDLTIEEELYTVLQDIFDLEIKLKQLQESMIHLKGEELEKLYEDYTKLMLSYELAEGYAAKSKVIGILKGLGFNEKDFTKPVKTLSGGEKTRVFLGKLLLSKPDIILLDEPTNHLDLSSIEWLETYLLNYKGTVIIVSHDRYFLDKIVNKVFDVDNTTVSGYLGNYSDFSEKKKQLQAAEEKAYRKQQEEIRHQESVIEKLRSFNREKSVRRAESRDKQLQKIERMDNPVEEKSAMKFFLHQQESSGKDVLEVENLAKSFKGRELFSNLNFSVKRGEHLAIMGDNGTGKTTILKILNNIITPDRGSIRFGSRVKIAYFDQEHQVLHPDKTLFDELQDSYPELNNTDIRNVLAAFLFTKEEVFKKIRELSGGERGRISLAKLMLSQANLLILDEPTNHLDMASKEILEKAIQDFEGTVIYVSHDRYFINKTATRILELKNKTLLNYIGNYDYYLEKKEDVEAAYSPTNLSSSAKVSDKKKNTRKEWINAKQEAAKTKKRKMELQKYEDRIAGFEADIENIHAEFLNPEIQSNPIRLMELQKEKEAIQEQLEHAYERWESLFAEEEE